MRESNGIYKSVVSSVLSMCVDLCEQIASNTTDYCNYGASGICGQVCMGLACKQVSVT